jgi:SWI/SNF-related matrix-associated actin-dependent regulator of chromatin subfamily A3
LTPEFAAAGHDASSSKPSSRSPTVVVATKKLDWSAQQDALDKMFDITLKEQYANLPNIAMPGCLRDISLMQYQIQGVRWLVKRETDAAPAPFYKQVKENGRAMYLCEITQSSQPEPPAPIRGSILADEMGLGKSIQTIALILLAPAVAGVTADSAEVHTRPPPSAAPTSKRCTLIVCPVSVLGNWTDQVSTFVQPGVLSVELYHGANRHAVLSEVRSGNVDILLVSYNTLAADFDGREERGSAQKKKKKARRESIFDIEFHRIVLDEAHTIRNSKTRSFRAVSLIRAERKLALSGTPLVNSSDDIYSLLSFLGVEPLNEKSIFHRAISQPIKNGDEIGLTRLRTTMGFLSLRRSKQNISVKLADKEVRLCSVEFMDDAHKRVYDA